MFLVKNLLVLKEQLAPFEANLVHAGKTLDFSQMTGTKTRRVTEKNESLLDSKKKSYIDSLSSFQQQRSLIFNPNALIGLAQKGMPRVVEVNLDSRREIDFQIKKVCEQFITNCVNSSVEPLTAFLIKVWESR